uniref:Putative Protease inhibitor n=1 Tax=Megacormus gertschi TaxID=1843536 RepID=A0A224XF17_9SCOR
MMLLLITIILATIVSSQVSSEYDNVKKLASANNEFAFKLHKLYNSHGNVFSSPASIFIALGMLYEGARGITAEEMRQTLSYNAAGLNDTNVKQHFQELLSLLGNASDKYKLDIANAIVSSARSPILQGYKDALNKYYGAILKELDFSTANTKAVREINDWVRNKTRGKISQLLKSLDAETALVLLNAVYFKGTWKTRFSPALTREDTFYNDGVDSVSVQMMASKNRFHYGEFKRYGVQALKMPYKGEDVSMVVLLPFDAKRLSKVEQELTSSELNDIISSMETETVFVNIPKFKLEDSKELQKNLTSLGMESAFTNGANLRGIAKEGNLKVSKIIHKAVVEVNEEGSEAAGATAILIIPYSSASITMKTFYVNHPFLFFIRDDRTGMILFYGRVNKL